MICRRCHQEAPDGAFCALCGAKQEKPKQNPRRRGNGAGTAIKRGKTWTGISTGYSYHAEVDGKLKLVRRRTWKGGFSTKKDALEWAATASGETVSEVPRLIDLWIGWSENDMLHLSHSKQTAYKIARRRIEPIIGRRIDDLTVSDLQDVVKTNCDSYYTARDVKSLLSKLYQRAMASNTNNGRVNQNLSEFVVLPKLEEDEPNPFSEEEVNKLWAAYNNGDRWIGYILLMIYTGMMPSELLACKRSMVDLDACEIHGAGKKTKERKKSAIVFPDFMVPVVADLLTYDSDNGRAKKDNFIQVNKDNFYIVFYEALERVGIDNPVMPDGRRRLTPYSARHTYGTEAVKLGVHPAVIQKMLRHSNQKTQERYTHLGSSEAHKAVNMMRPETEKTGSSDGEN